MLLSADVSIQSIGVILKGQSVYDSLSVPKCRYVTTNKRCVTSQKSEGLSHIISDIVTNKENV